MIDFQRAVYCYHGELPMATKGGLRAPLLYYTCCACCALSLLLCSDFAEIKDISEDTVSPPDAHLAKYLS
jgi:hypothetical protein